MPRFAANLSMLFCELPLAERFAAAARAGFTAVEVQFPYELPAARIAELLREHKLQLVLHNLPAGDWAAGERGIACHPDRVDEFRAGVAQAIAYAMALGCPQLNCLAGIVPAGVSEAEARATFVANLRHAAPELKRAGLKLLVEPINTFDIPGFFVSRSDAALALLGEVGADNLFLQYDVYHAQRMEGELGGTLARHLPRIAHIQIADNPGRHEPGTGEIHYPWLFRHLDALGYAGWIGCEYKPATTTEAGLGWLREALADPLARRGAR
jgi:hydroxypyruvate isomerase